MHAGLCMVRLLILVLRSGQTAASVCCCVASARAAAMHLIRGSQLQVLHRAALCILLLSGLGKSLSWSRWNFLPFVLCVCPLGADHTPGVGGYCGADAAVWLVFLARLRPLFLLMTAAGIPVGALHFLPLPARHR